MLTAIAFILINVIGSFLALNRSPFWGLILYINLYFNPLDHNINWWAGYIPQANWGIIVFAILFLSVCIHHKKLSGHPLGSIKWIIPYFVLSIIVTLVNYSNYSVQYLYMLFTYVVISISIVKIIQNNRQYSWLCLSMVILTANLSLNAYLYGERVHGRLEGIGPADALGSNEFGLLLAAVLPLLFPYLLKGKKYEKVICVLSLPFIVNAFILCNSRGAFVALFVACCIGIFVAGKKIRKKMFVAFVLSILLFMFLADKEFIGRMSSLVLTDDAMRDQEVAAQLSSGRTEIWKYGFEMAKDHPFGVGLNGFKHLAHLYMPAEMLNTREMSYSYGIRAAHSTYLQVLVEQGVAGLLLLLFMCSHALFTLIVRFRNLVNSEQQIQQIHLQVLALFVSLCVSLLGGLFTSRLYYEFFWWQIALASILASPYFKYGEGEVSYQ